MVSFKHKFHSNKTGGGDPTIVGPNEWNDEHDMEAGAGTVLGRDTASTGDVQELPLAISPQGDANFNAGKGYLLLPRGLGADRPETPQEGMIRYNTELKLFEGWNGTAWIPATSAPVVIPGGAFLIRHSGLQIVEPMTDTLVTFNLETFDTSGAFDHTTSKATLDNTGPNSGVWQFDTGIGFIIPNTGELDVVVRMRVDGVTAYNLTQRVKRDVSDVVYTALLTGLVHGPAVVDIVVWHNNSIALELADSAYIWFLGHSIAGTQV